MNTGTGQKLYQKACSIIPGGTQLLSKRPEMLLPDNWPCYYSKAKGITVWDLDGNSYQDVGYHGIGACVLGYGDDDVDNAVIDAIKCGSTSILNSPQEVELAELLVDLHPWADMARFSRSGGEAMSIAVRIARSATNRDVVLFCGYHGWHDWYLAANLAQGNDNLSDHLLPGLKAKGVPSHLSGSAVPFHYNDIEEFHRRLSEIGDRLAAVVMEPVRSSDPLPNYLETIADLTKKAGAVLIFDEITSGFRLCPGGAHLHFGVDPDISVFAKSLSNGYPMGAVIGRREVMEAAQDTFVSSTAWTESTGPAASIAAVNKYIENQVQEHQKKAGEEVCEIWTKNANATSELAIDISGIKPLSHLSLKTHESGNPSEQKTFLTQEMLKRGFLATTSFYATSCHDAESLAQYDQAISEVFGHMSDHLKAGTLREALDGPVVHTGFYRLS
jgi:glutamate-1-semialdehyde 2,1-aminomutase